MHRQHSPLGIIVGQSEPLEQSAIDDQSVPMFQDLTKFTYPWAL